MKLLRKALTVATLALAAATPVLATSTPAFAASRDGVCDSGEFCYYYNSDNAGSISDFTTSIDDYGTTQPDCYEFKGAGNGQGQCIKNNAASVWNRTGKTVTVYFNTGYAGASQSIAAGFKGNLNATLKNENASHKIGTSGDTCSGAGLGNPNTCAEAVTWANNHLGSTSLGTGTCDHVVALAYGWSNSGSTSAAAHWSQMPSQYKHVGDSSGVPAGALAFFSGGSQGYGHVMISLGGGNFASTDIGTDGRYQAGRYGRTTIAQIESSFNENYLGWTQPWFNH